MGRASASSWTDGRRIAQRQEPLNCNWLQAQENSADVTHTYFLHRHALYQQGQRDRGVMRLYRPFERYGFQPFEWGQLKAWEYAPNGQWPAERAGGNPLIFPNVLRNIGYGHDRHFRVPVDDTHTHIFIVQFHPGEPYASSEELANPPIQAHPPQYLPDGRHSTGDFLSQDRMAWETQGRIMDRSKEHLLSGLAQGKTLASIGQDLVLGQPSISRILHGAERKAGIELVQRQGHRLALTLAGGSSPETIEFFHGWPDLTPEDDAALLRRGHDVTLVGRNEKVGVGLGGGTRWVLVKELTKAGVAVLRSTAVVAIEPDGVRVRGPEGEQTLPADTVVLATGYRPDETLLRQLDGLAPEVYHLGDAESVQHALNGTGRALEVALAL